MSTSKIGDLKNVLKSLETNPAKYAKDISIDDLVELLKQLAYYYYSTDEPLISDTIYDMLRDILEERDPNNEYLQQVGTPISKDAVQLPFPMASLNKIKPNTSALDNWKTNHKGPYVLSDKLDGVSGLLYKTDNKFKLFTRGDAISGRDITHLINYLLSNKYKPGKIPNNTAIRGEIIISKDNFKLVKDKYKNARNAIIGLVTSKNFSIELAKLTDFIGYAIINPKYTQEAQMEKLKEWNFPVVDHKVLNDITNDILSNHLKERRISSKHEVDGTVVIDSSKIYDIDSKNPDYGFAFKMILTDQVAEATVLEVEWNVSKHGYLKPIANIMPVNLVGVTIRHVTAFNAKYVVDNVLGPGAVIKLVRSGDVIPHILEVLKPASSGAAQLPTISHKWNDTNVDFLVKDIHGAAKDAITIKSLAHFFKVMGVKFISEGLVTKLVESGYKTVPEILNADMKKLAEIPGIGEKIITKVFENTRVAFETSTLEQVMAASNVFGIGLGTRKLKVVVDAYPNILNEKWNDATITEKLMVLDGFDTKTVKQFILNFAKFKHFFGTLKNIKLISVGQLEKPAKPVQPARVLFANMKIVFTGFRSAELEDFIKKNGGDIGTTVSKNTTLLVYTETEGSKYKKATELNIKTMTKDDFIKEYQK